MFSATASNQITYLYFCTLGGLAHRATTKVQHYTGRHFTHTTYHLTSVR